MLSSAIFWLFFLSLAAFSRGRAERSCLGHDRIPAFPPCGFCSSFFVLGWLVTLFRQESCIRRDIRHEPMRIGCRIHPETFLPVMAGGPGPGERTKPR
jgi:hypothetical protein